MNDVDFINSLEKNREIHMYLENDSYTSYLRNYYAKKNDSNGNIDNPIDLFLYNILRQEDKRYIDLLKEYFSDKLSYKLNRGNNLKLYLVSVMYFFNQDNYDNYKAFFDDIMSLKIDPYLDYYIGFEINDLLDDLEVVFKNPNYSSTKELREFLSSNKKIFTSEYRNQLFSKECKKLKEIARITRFIYDEELKEKATKLLINYSFSSDSSSDLFNLTVLLTKNRCENFFNNLFKVESNIEIQKEFLNFLSRLKRGVFDDLNINNTFEGDSFNIIFNVIFDSDSYIELCNRLGVLEVANNMYPFHQSDYLETIKTIGDRNFKDNYRGEVVSYPENSINIVVKPDRIIDRMKDLYFKIDDSISYDFLDDIHDKSKCIFDVIDKLNGYMSNPFNRIKQKIKSKKK